MGISAFDSSNTDNYDLQYVPHRLTALELCVLSCYYVQAGELVDIGDRPKTMVTREDHCFTPIRICDIDHFIGISIDAGLVALRTLLNFLGIKLDNQTLTEQAYAHTVQQHGLPLITVAQATSILGTAQPATQLGPMMLEALQTASKASAHFTDAGSTVAVERLGWACYAVSLLIRRHYFDAKELAQPKTLIPDDADSNPKNWHRMEGPGSMIC
jgi:hypothetical protein